MFLFDIKYFRSRINFTGDRNITTHIIAHALSTRGTTLDQLASVVWESGPLPQRLSDSLTREDVRDLLGSADAFVLPTRGVLCSFHCIVCIFDCGCCLCVQVRVGACQSPRQCR